MTSSRETRVLPLSDMPASHFSWLRGLGKTGGFLASALTLLLFAYPALTLSVVVTAALVAFTSAVHWAQLPYVYVSAGIFIFLLWTFIGVSMLRDRQKTKTVRLAASRWSFFLAAGLKDWPSREKARKSVTG
jgi:hypothetical protein